MTNRNPIRRKLSHKPSEAGYMMVAVIFLLAILVISLAVAAPRVKESIQRERELETMERGKQYIRAIQLYYRKFHAYPPNMDALVKTQEIRFLRKKYIDPTTGKDEWKPVMFGQNKAPTAMGFFGQPLAGSSIAGIGPGGGNGLNGATNADGSQNNSGFGSSNSGFGSNNSTFGSNTGNSSIFASNNQSGSNPTSTTNGNSTGTSSSSTDPNASGTPGTNSGTGGQTFGGAGIIGFSPGSPKQSIYVYKKKNHYNEWEFTYDPAMEQMSMGGSSGAGSGAQPVGTSPIGTPGSGPNPAAPDPGSTQTPPTPTPTPPQN